MFLSKLPWLYVLQVLVVGLAVSLTLWVTHNELALLGLFFLWQPPPLAMDPRMQAEEPEPNHIGFVDTDAEGS